MIKGNKGLFYKSALNLITKLNKIKTIVRVNFIVKETKRHRFIRNDLNFKLYLKTSNKAFVTE